MKYIEWFGTHFIGLFQAGADQFKGMVTGIIPLLIILLTFSNALASLIGRDRVDRGMQKFAKNPLLRYTLLPVLSVLLLTNPMAYTFGKYLPEAQKPAFYDAAVSFVHPVTGLFPYANGAELFVFLGIANGITKLGLSTGPLAIRYFLAGLIVIGIRGMVTEKMTAWLAHKEGISLASPDNGDIPCAAGGEDPDAPCRMAESASENSLGKGPAGPYQPLRISRGPDGWGTGLTLLPTEKAHTILSVTGGGIHPVAMAMGALSGMNVVDGFHQSIPEEEISCVVIDCGGTARIGVYPMKNIPTVDVLASDPSGPLARYIKEENFVSGVGEGQIRLASPEEIARALGKEPLRNDFGPEKNGRPEEEKEAEEPENTQKKASPQGLDSAMEGPRASGFSAALISFSQGIGRVMSVFYQSGREAVSTTLKTVLPFMAFISMLMGMITYTGIGGGIAKIMQPFAGSLPGMMVLALLCSLPFLSPVLGPGAVIAQVVGVLLGSQIGAGLIPPAYALPALFAINAQVGCDFIPVGLSLGKAKAKTVEIGVPAILYSRVLTGVISVLIGYLMSLGLYG